MTNATKSRQTYHHGNLRHTLIDEATALLAEKGAQGFSMREVARRAEVAVAAPAHHFGSAQGLLTAIATCGFQRLTQEQRAAMAKAEDPVTKVTELCRTYVDMATAYPGYAAIMFRWDLLDDGDAACKEASTESFELLRSAVRTALPAGTQEAKVTHLAKALWAAMHGFVTLNMTGSDEAEARLSFFVRSLLRGASA